MRITQSDIQYTSQHTETTQRTAQETLRTWIGDHRPDFEGKGVRPATDTVHFSPTAQAACHSAATRPTTDPATETEETNDPKLMVLVHIVERMTGQKIHLASWKEMHTQQHVSAEAVPSETPTQPKRAGFGVEYDAVENYSETETSVFSAKGVVITEDGREIQIAMDVTQQRAFSETHSVSIRLGDAKLKDPLVLNFSGQPVTLTSAQCDFDIDADGTVDRIAFVAPGNGFLALDRNGDGQINDGRELFGAMTGAGFTELATYDTDGNHWIDENDPIYTDLRVWFKDGQGQEMLLSLKQAGVGAIALGQVATPFSIKDSANTLLGKIQSTGVFLTEAGAVHTVQQVDLVA